MILDDGIRPDNRKLTEIRPIWCETSVLPRTHGSGLFQKRTDSGAFRCYPWAVGEAQTMTAS